MHGVYMPPEMRQRGACLPGCQGGVRCRWTANWRFGQSGRRREDRMDVLHGPYYDYDVTEVVVKDLSAIGVAAAPQ